MTGALLSPQRYGVIHGLAETDQLSSILAPPLTRGFLLLARNDIAPFNMCSALEEGGHDCGANQHKAICHRGNDERRLDVVHGCCPHAVSATIGCCKNWFSEIGHRAHRSVLPGDFASSHRAITIRGAREHNLKNIEVEIRPAMRSAPAKSAIIARRCAATLCPESQFVRRQPIDNTPMHPEYPCAHCISSAAVASVIEAVLGSADIPEVAMTSTTAPGVTHRWTNVWTYADEVSLARIYAGFHYRFSTRVGQDMGRQIGRLVTQKLMREANLAQER